MGRLTAEEDLVGELVSSIKRRERFALVVGLVVSVGVVAGLALWLSWISQAIGGTI